MTAREPSEIKRNTFPPSRRGNPRLYAHEWTTGSGKHEEAWLHSEQKEFDVDWQKTGPIKIKNSNTTANYIQLLD